MDEKFELTSKKAKGGHARAVILSPERREQIAKTAAAARWGEKPFPKATHAGDVSLSNGVSIPVSVLENGTRVLSQTGLQTTLGMSASGASAGVQRIAQFAEKIAAKSNISSDLVIRLKSPILFIPIHGGRPAYGYEATTLIDLCELVLDARNAKALVGSQARFADAASIVIRAFAKTGIIAVIDEVTGYQEVRPKDALQAYLEKIIAKELAAWVKTFPDEFYENIYKLKGWTWPGMGKNRYSVVAHYTNDLVYERLAPGLRKELQTRNPKNEKGYRPAKNFQWLTAEIGHPMLAQHLYSLMMFQRLAIAQGYGWNRFVKMVDRVHPKKGDTLELPFDDLGDLE